MTTQAQAFVIKTAKLELTTTDVRNSGAKLVGLGRCVYAFPDGSAITFTDSGKAVEFSGFGAYKTN